MWYLPHYIITFFLSKIRVPWPLVFWHSWADLAMAEKRIKQHSELTCLCQHGKHSNCTLENWPHKHGFSYSI
jgi:hypothetical protein